MATLKKLKKLLQNNNKITICDKKYGNRKALIINNGFQILINKSKGFAICKIDQNGNNTWDFCINEKYNFSLTQTIQFFNSRIK